MCVFTLNILYTFAYLVLETLNQSYMYSLLHFLMEKESLEQADNQSRSRKQDGEKTSSLGSSERQNQKRNIGHHYTISSTLQWAVCLYTDNIPSFINRVNQTCKVLRNGCFICIGLGMFNTQIHCDHNYLWNRNTARAVSKFLDQVISLLLRQLFCIQEHPTL